MGWKTRLVLIFVVGFFVILTLTAFLLSSYTSQKPSFIASNIIARVTGSKKQLFQFAYAIAESPVEFTFRTDLSFSMPKFRYSSALQEFLNESDFDLNHLSPEIQTTDTIPRVVNITVTNDFKIRQRTTYSLDGVPKYSYQFDYDQPTKKLSIMIYISEEGWRSIYTRAESEYRLPVESVIGREILYALSYFDRSYPNATHGKRISRYLNSDFSERML